VDKHPVVLETTGLSLDKGDHMIAEDKGDHMIAEPSVTDNRESVAASTIRELRELAELSGDPGQFNELIDLFLRELQLAAASMTEAFANRDADGLGKLAHALKGSSGSMGAARLALLCLELEEMTKNTDLQEAKGQVVLIESEICVVQELLAGETVRLRR
jgi:HPt (histidine-containing phosphotransfer) domain-containing protein